jgi:hypothetical protein
MGVRRATSECAISLLPGGVPEGNDEITEIDVERLTTNRRVHRFRVFVGEKAPAKNALPDRGLPADHHSRRLGPHLIEQLFEGMRRNLSIIFSRLTCWN